MSAYNHLPIPRKIYYVDEGWWIFKEKKSRRSTMADLLYDAATNLIRLKQHISVMNNRYVPDSLKNEIRIGLDDGFFILWDVCHRLALIQMQQLPIEEHALQTVCDDIRKLINISNQAEKELGQLTLERDATRMKFYQETFRRFTEEAREMRNANRLLSSSEY
jgi:hypothetical protein